MLAVSERSKERESNGGDSIDMAFLNPTFLWFMLGGSIPIIIHLLHRQKFRRVRWAAMEFLLQALKKTQRRLQLENIILLLLRILIMVLLALAISRPFFKEAPVEALADSDTHHIYVIDNSYSMAYKKGPKSSLDLARAEAVHQFDSLRKLSEEDKVSVITMSSYPDIYLAESNKRERIKKALEEITLSHYGTSAMLTFQQISDVITRSRNKLKRVTLFTDLQRCGWDAGEKSKDFAKILGDLCKRGDTRIAIVDVATGNETDNRAIVDLRVDQKVVATKRTTSFSVDVQNWSTSSFPAVVVTLFVDGSALPQKTTPLPAGSLATLNFSHEFIDAGPHFVEAAIEPDFIDVDDHRYLALDVKDGLRGLLVDGEPGQRPWESETDFLKFALDPSGTGRFYKLDIKTTDLFLAEQLDAYDFVVLANVQSLTNDKVEKLEAYVSAGGGLFISMGNKVDKVSWNELFFKKGKGLMPAELVEIAGTGPAQERQMRRMNHVNFDHKAFGVFKKGLQHAPRDLVFYQYYKLDKVDTDAVLVADYDDPFATPLFLDKKFGDGHVIFYNNTLDGDWNAGIQGRAPFLPIMHSICEHLSARPLTNRNLFVGQPLIHVMAVGQYVKQFRLETATEGEITIAPRDPKAGETSIAIVYPMAKAMDRRPDEKLRPMDNEGLKTAGKYVLRRGDAKDDERPVSYFACNVGPRNTSPEEIVSAEGNLERIGPDELMQRYPDFKFDLIGSKTAAGSVDVQRDPSHLGWYLLGLLAGFLVIEAILAWLFGKAKQ